MNDYNIAFQCEVENISQTTETYELSALVITTKNDFKLVKKGDILTITGMGKSFDLCVNNKEMVCRVSKDAPSGFMYHGIQDILFDENRLESGEFESKEPISLSISKAIMLEPGEKYSFEWILNFNKDDAGFESLEQDAKLYWKNWLSETSFDIDDSMVANVIALKAINMKGFIPADLTGHYFASDDIALYVRDALHGARAFLYSGFYKECKSIVELVLNLRRKDNYELYQRYNSLMEPDEGANNNVFSQIDVIGYLLRVIADYYALTGELLAEVDVLINEVKILHKIHTKNGLYGPEGGVNEGVYGPAYITSTNIFIAGGLSGLLQIIKNTKNYQYEEILKKKLNDLVDAINGTFMEDDYYAYGYVDYHSQLIKRYDTPQLFGASLGYPIDENYKKNFDTLTTIATYYDFGYGYSEQEYHDGPWIFNTAYAAQNAYMFGDIELYNNIIKWIEDHKNQYGLLPEAIDARTERNSFINPLMWANSEYVCAKQAKVITKLRNGECYDN
jgi:GH15 family glucan-1,4-alpha-glucosidase